METFETPSDRSFIEYDVSGRPAKVGSLDLEAQGISSEFKRPPY